MNMTLNIVTPAGMSGTSLRLGASESVDGTNVVALHPGNQNLSHTLRFIAPQDGEGRTVIEVLDGRSGAVIRRIPWNARQWHVPGQLLDTSA